MNLDDLTTFNSGDNHVPYYYFTDSSLFISMLGYIVFLEELPRSNVNYPSYMYRLIHFDDRQNYRPTFFSHAQLKEYIGRRKVR